MSRFTGLSRSILGLGAIIAASATPAATPATADPALLLKDAVAMAGSAVDLAASQGKAMAVVIVNREGRVILSQRMDGASFVSMDVALGKATTAAALGIPTKLLEQQLKTGDVSALSVAGVIPIAGGVPVIVQGRTIAAVGVSGGMPADDEAVAMAARDHFMKSAAR